MPKLSDIFLNLLGNSLQGEQGTPAAREARQIQLDQNARAQAENARANVGTLSSLSQNYDALPPDFIGPKNAGSFTPQGSDLASLGANPGTTYQPISRTATTPFVTPGKTPGSSNLSYSSRPVKRGEVLEPPINTLSPYAALLGHQMGFQKDLFDKYDSDMHTAQTALAGVASRLPKGIGQSLVDSVASGVGIPAEFTQSPEYQANAALIQKFSNQYLEAKQNRDAVLNGQGGGAGITNPPIKKPLASDTLGYDPLGILTKK